MKTIPKKILLASLATILISSNIISISHASIKRISIKKIDEIFWKRKFSTQKVSIKPDLDNVLKIDLLNEYSNAYDVDLITSLESTNDSQLELILEQIDILEETYWWDVDSTDDILTKLELLRKMIENRLENLTVINSQNQFELEKIYDL